MPNSDSNQIPTILRLVSEASPASLLDIGIGWGKYGMLFRMCLEHGFANLSDRKNWRLRIDGVEAFPEYVGDIQRSVYDHIYQQPITQALGQLGDYDLIFMGDVIEHLPKKEGLELLHALLKKTKNRLIISTPNGPYEQGSSLGNDFECHRSFWQVDDFQAFAHNEIYANKKSIIAVLANAPIEQKGRRWRMGEYPRRPWPCAWQAWVNYRLTKWSRKKQRR